ncbi:RelA/SpoT domain-containing protein [Bradyrhizobium yuanmingense]|uniref:RelA/SpoT domain-containing protein n=1 Tax=Bradyrhizobium yuanmingense TaxID=108015 RepID=UPI0021A8331E|nr:RelA/SpoT domain-containing protein [Bradyrhizobium sp. CB1024]UWU83240.1 RelA/SpoT domain-containing protein [Bradyrhizobium sp. CB1024]
MSDLAKVESFCSRNRAGFKRLVEEVLAACEQVEDSTVGLIYRSYSRGEKQAGGEELKDAAKILDKIDPPLTDGKLTELHDIIGVTIVIYYPDDALHILDMLSAVLGKKGIRPVGDPKWHSGGYHALHAVFRSSGGAHAGLRCEVQIKTVLHDAWSAKMHDLTYKPAGAIDGRLSGLMGAISSQIEGIEQQSITIRNIINGRHSLETRAFQSLCEHMISVLGEGRLEPLRAGSPEAAALWERIDVLRAESADGNYDVHRLNAIVDEIDTLCAQPPLVKFGWLLMTKVASGLLFGDRSRELSIQIERFIDYSTSNPADPDLKSEVLLSIPNAFYVAGDLRRAAEYCERLTSSNLTGRFDADTQLVLNFNRITYLLELEHLRPMRNKSHLQTLKADVEKILGDERFQKMDALKSAFMDTQGLFRIVFGETPAEVRQGIELCTESVKLAAEFERDVAEACLNWRLQAGWLRYFDLTAKPEKFSLKRSDGKS